MLVTLSSHHLSFFSVEQILSSQPQPQPRTVPLEARGLLQEDTPSGHPTLLEVQSPATDTYESTQTVKQ